MKVSRCDGKYQPFRFLQAFRRSTNSRNSPLNFPETHKTTLESCASSRLCEQFGDSGKEKKRRRRRRRSQKSPSRLDSESLRSRAPPLRKTNFSPLNPDHRCALLRSKESRPPEPVHPVAVWRRMSRRRTGRGSLLGPLLWMPVRCVSSPRINQLGLVSLLRRLPVKYELHAAGVKTERLRGQDDFRSGASE